MKTENHFSSQPGRLTKQLVYWTLAWLISMALVAFGPKIIWNNNLTITILLIAFNTIIGIGMILKNIRYINALDELQKKINLEAMAIALGVGIVGGLSYSMLDIKNVIAFNAEISYLVILISITYLVGLVIGKIRYK